MNPALVIWADAHSADIASWTPAEDIEDVGEWLNRTVGWVVPDAKKGHVTVCQSVTPDDQVDHVLHIPEQMVRQIHYLVVKPTE
jgi:hypothetical protein